MILEYLDSVSFQVLAVGLFKISLFIFLYSVVLYGEFHPLRTVFGAVAIGFGAMDLWVFKQPIKIKNNWLIFHLSKMLAGYTTAITGFFVAQNILHGYFNWFTPTVLCLVYILFWIIKLKKPLQLTLNANKISQNRG